VRSLERTLLDIKDSRTSSTFRRDEDEAASPSGAVVAFR